MLTILLSIPGFSQKYSNLKTYNVDSLLLILPDQIGEDRVNSLNYLAVSLSFIDFDQSIQYADEAMNLAKEVDYEEGIAAAFRNYGQIYVYQGNWPQALNNYLEALVIYEKLEKTRTAGWVCYEIGKTHYFANNYEKASEYAYIALDIFRERTDDGITVGNAKDTITIYSGLGETYALMGMFDKSLELDLKALDLMKRNNFKNVELMMATFHSGALFYRIGELDSAKVYFFKALTYPDESLNMKTLKYRNIIFLGLLHYDAGEIDSALYYLQTAYEFYKKKGFLYWALKTSRDLGYIYYKNNELNSAEKHLQQSEKIFNEMLTKNSWYRHDSLRHIANYGLELYFPLPPVRLKEMMWSDGRAMYKLLYQLNDAKNNTAEAYKYHIAYSDAKDTLTKLQRNREIVELQARYETTQKEKQIDFLAKENSFKTYKLKQSRLFLFGLIGLVILIVILAFILLRQYKLRDQQKNLLLQQKLFRSQMNPHFLFNSLSSIHNYIIHEDAAKAGQYLSKFSKLVRNILDSSFEEYIQLEDEILTIKNYLELQKVRYEAKFKYSIEVDEAIDTENLMIPPMLAQPIIENAIEHGIKHKKTSGEIHVRFKLKDGFIIFEVEDDGIGRKKALEIMQNQDKDHKSLSTTITYERIRVLNKRLKKKISMQVEDLVDDHEEPTGTRVTFEIPVIFN
jgi:tetratricopeptide (TPR) repeat protein